MNVEKIWLHPFKFLHKHIKPFCFKYSHENECGVVYIIYKSAVLDSGNMVELIKGRFFALQIITYSSLSNKRGEGITVHDLTICEFPPLLFDSK